MMKNKLIYLFFILFFIANILNANSLKNEQSPYLLQHKDNPVNWMAWKNESLKKATKENKLIFLSIGYSTCHWCHVMEEESFENQDVANVLNKSFISIKVDREEMPQIDEYYQKIYQIMNGQGGGWPLTIILTPDKKPFFSATYLPKNKLIQITNTLVEVYQNDKKRVLEVASQIDDILKNKQKPIISEDKLELDHAISLFKGDILQGFDKKNGGLGGAPKFPMATTLNTILDMYSITKDKIFLEIANKTLTKMAKGGIYDQIEGGFYRYSTDEKWQIPHYEKMLYTQAELIKVYTKAYQITKNKLYKNVVINTIKNVNERFKKNNLLYGASDADSLTSHKKKEEGYYFVFSYDKTYNFLKNKGYDEDKINMILKYFNITKKGNFENGLSNAYIVTNNTLDDIDKIKKDLKQLRATNIYPFIDNKIQTSWNSLYISSLFSASKINDKYGKNGLKLLDSLLNNMIINEKLYHQKLENKPLKVDALFEDYSFLISALIQGYQYSFDKKYIKKAVKLAKDALDKFYIENQWHLSDDEYKSMSNIYDGSYVSMQSNMIENLFKLATLTDDTKMYQLATKMINENINLIKTNPTSVATAFNVYIGSKKQYKVLKTTKNKFEENQGIINNINNPYLVFKVVKDKQYLACTINSCFVFGQDLSKVLEGIENYN